MPTWLGVHTNFTECLETSRSAINARICKRKNNEPNFRGLPKIEYIKQIGNPILPDIY